MKKSLILANGKIPSKKEILYLQKIGYDFLVCADGGANSAFKLGLAPNLVIGDLDSIKNEVLNYYTKSTIVKKIKRQNDTDVEKCLKYLISKNFTEVILLGGTGDRLDHSLCNLAIVKKYFEKIKIKILHEKTFLTPYKGKVILDSEIGETISIYGFDKKTKITSTGLKYPLLKTNLNFGDKESTSNEASKNKVELNITGGVAFVIRNYNCVKKYGNI